MIFCVPSYKRANDVRTLKIYKNIKLFVAESESDAYAANNDCEIVKMPDEVQGNIARVRNYILNYEFARGDRCIIIDDDFSGITRIERGERKFLDEDRVQDFADHGFALCDEWGFKLWGVNVNCDNGVYLKFKPFSTTSAVLAPFNGHLKNDLRYDENIPLKEDYDYFIQHCNKYRGVLRFDAYHYICKQGKQAGGCADMRSMDEERRQFDLLQRKWGTRIVKADKNSAKTFDYNPIIRIPIGGV